MYKKGRLLITRHDDKIVSILTDIQGRAVHIGIHDPANPGVMGNIYAGRIERVCLNLGGAFVELGNGMKGFLKPGENINPVFLNRRKSGPLRNGDILLVRASTEPIKTKGAILTWDITIPGRYVVFTPYRSGVKYSVALEDRSPFEKHAEELNGFIVRTNAASADIAEILEEARKIRESWERSVKKIPKKAGLVYAALPEYLADVRDIHEELYNEIVTDDIMIYNEIKEYPGKGSKTVRLYEDRKVGFKTIYEIEKHLSDALKRTVYLKSGGYIVIEPTEALVSIDVNSGSHISKRNPEGEILNLNLEAAVEVARQIRVRNLSGIIVVDFINMKNPKNSEILVEELRKMLRDDPGGAKLIDITRLGLVEITRKKERRPLYEALNL
ncbi:MAG: ribonuclease E/G [Lachnospiraceae bacterium]|jgi:ribonuclease G